MKNLKNWLNPFLYIAGGKAIAWGAAGMIVSTVLSWLSGFHYHGLLHFGPAPNDALWVYAVEHIVVWLVPSLMFYVAGALFSSSKVRACDVFGTVLFAQLPLIGMNLLEFLPPMQALAGIDTSMSAEQILAIEGFTGSILLSMVGVVFIAWMLILMFNALKVACNLKGWKLWVPYLIAVIGGDVLCRIIISAVYSI